MKAIKKLLLAVLFIFPVLFVACEDDDDDDNGNGDYTVSIVNDKFEPMTLEIVEGSIVTWTNNDTMDHTVTSANEYETTAESFDSGIIAPGESYSLEFNEPGTYDYVCSIHTGEQGEITVLGAK